MSQITNWKCDRCGATEAVKDQSMPKTNSLPAKWARLTGVETVFNSYDLCANCTERAVSELD